MTKSLFISIEPAMERIKYIYRAAMNRKINDAAPLPVSQYHAAMHRKRSVMTHPRPLGKNSPLTRRLSSAATYRGRGMDVQISMSHRLAVVRSVRVILFVAERDSQITRRLDDVVIARDLFAFADRDRERDGGDV